jgi:hypothetical protein
MTVFVIGDVALHKSAAVLPGTAAAKAGARKPYARAVIDPRDSGLWVPGSTLCVGRGIDDVFAIDDIINNKDDERPDLGYFSKAESAIKTDERPPKRGLNSKMTL